MIKISYDELTKRPFQMAVQKLSNMPLNTPEAFRVKHIVKELQKHLNEMGENFRKDILAKYAKGGSEAEPAPKGKSEELNLPFEAIKGMEAEAKAAIEKFGKREFSIKFKKIRGDFLLSVGAWSVGELIALEPIVSDHVLPVDEETVGQTGAGSEQQQASLHN